jgi:hypothetical protein
MENCQLREGKVGMYLTLANKPSFFYVHQHNLIFIILIGAVDQYVVFLVTNKHQIKLHRQPYICRVFHQDKERLTASIAQASVSAGVQGLLVGIFFAIASTPSFHLLLCSPIPSPAAAILISFF